MRYAVLIVPLRADVESDEVDAALFDAAHPFMDEKRLAAVTFHDSDDPAAESKLGVEFRWIHEHGERP